MAATGDKASALGEREPGGCPVCAWPVQVSDNFIRIANLFVHMPCALARRGRNRDLWHSTAA